MTANQAADELPVVTALRSLSIFTADQSGAYREHFASVAAVLGDDVPTRLAGYAAQWAAGQQAGALVLTGNAGTGKTAVAEAYCRAVGGVLPTGERPTEVAAGRWVVKDLSGLAESARPGALEQALAAAVTGQALICANEGVLRDCLRGPATADLDRDRLRGGLDSALRAGAARTGTVLFANTNRQRPTADRLWPLLLDYVTRPALWTGCTGCPVDSAGCALRANADQLRRADVREQLRTLVRLGTGQAVPTLREVLAVLSWAIVGPSSCRQVKEDARDRGLDGQTATAGYFTRAVGGGLPAETVERSPLMSGMRRSGLGDVSDLEVDGWLRDSTGAPERVRAVSGNPDASRPSSAADDAPATPAGPLAGTRSPLDRVRVGAGSRTFYSLGEMVSTDEDPAHVDLGLRALVEASGDDAAGQSLWRQRIFFEASADLGGPGGAARRLLDYRHLVDLVDLARAVAEGEDTVLKLQDLVRGLNFLVTGFSSPDEGLVVPDPACLFARDPGSFRPARPSLVHARIAVSRLTLAVPDQGLVAELVDVDPVDVDLLVDGDPLKSLRIRPRMYEAIREAQQFQGPVGQGVAEMSDLRGFYGRLAAGVDRDTELRVAQPEASPPALLQVRLPHFAAGSGT